MDDEEGIGGSCPDLVSDIELEICICISLSFKLVSQTSKHVAIWLSAHCKEYP